MTTTEITLTCLAAFLAWNIRYQLWKHWKANPAKFFYLDAPLPVDTDAGYYVLAAQGRRLGHPQNLLSLMIRLFSTKESNVADMLLAGNRMLMVTAPLSVVAITWAFSLLDMTLPGIVCAMGTVSCGIYLARTQIGRIDTDQLNVTFFVVICALIARLSYVSTEAEFVQLALGLAVITFLYDFWFPKPIFLVLFALMVTVAAWVSLGLYATPVGVAFFLATAWREFPYMLNYAKQLFSAYGKAPGESSAQTTISELDRPGFVRALQLTLGEPVLFPIVLLGLFALAVLRPEVMLVMIPSVAFFIFAMERGQRFLPYAAPAAWLGIGFLFDTPALAFVLILLAFHTSTHKNTVHPPRISAGITFVLHQLKRMVRKGTVVTWWDYGFWVRLWSEHEVVCDPQAPWAPEVKQVALILTETDEEVAYDQLCDLVPSGPIYIMVTSDMFGWWHAITKIAGRPEQKVDGTLFHKLMLNSYDRRMFKEVVSLSTLVRVFELMDDFMPEKEVKEAA